MKARNKNIRSERIHLRCSKEFKTVLRLMKEKSADYRYQSESDILHYALCILGAKSFHGYDGKLSVTDITPEEKQLLEDMYSKKIASL